MMDTKKPFIFNHKIYYAGTVVTIHSEYQQNFKFHSTLKFVGYEACNRMYCFSVLYDNWTIYRLSSEQINIYIASVLKEGDDVSEDTRIDTKYIDGIVSAWIWYIFIMLFALILQGAASVATVWIIATIIFFSWRHNKIKGG